MLELYVSNFYVKNNILFFIEIKLTMMRVDYFLYKVCHAEAITIEFVINLTHQVQCVTQRRQKVEK